MTLSSEDQERYAKMSALEEQAEGAGTGSGGESHHGADAAAIGQQLLLDALGSAEAVDRAVRGGRPNLGGRSAGGASPTLRVRVTEDRQHELEILRTRLHRQHTSDIVREALDEYVARHMQDA